MNLAANAEPILQARKRGMKPADMVLVSLCGNVFASNHTVFAKPSQRYSWTWVRSLDIAVCIGKSADWAETVKDIAKCRPKYLCIWSEHDQWGATVYLIPTAEDISKPVHLWTYELDFTPWLDTENKAFAEGV